jgi:hypothetical protein
MARIRNALEVELKQKVPHWTLHDLRRTMATGLQRLGVRLEVTEAVLNHLSGSRSGIVGVYQRHNYFEEKRAALAAWAREVKRLARADASTRRTPAKRKSARAGAKSASAKPAVKRGGEAVQPAAAKDTRLRNLGRAL